MNAKTANKQLELPFNLVGAKTIAEALSVSIRQVGYWAAEGKIPSYRFGRRCVRYSLPAVLEALEVPSND